MNVLLGGFHLYGLLIGVGVIVGVLVVERMSKHFGRDTRWLDHSLPWVVLGAIIGARIYHLASDWQLYQGASLLDLVAIWRGGLGFLGAVGGGLLAFVLWAKITKQSLTTFFSEIDLLVFGIPVAQSIGRLGNLVNQELYGLPTDLSWGLVVNGKKYHPLFLYEALLNLILFVVLMLLARKKMLMLGKGQYASVYLFGYTFIRFWLEYLRIETARWDSIWGMFSIAQWVCLTCMMISVVLFWVRRHVPKKNWDFSLE